MPATLQPVIVTPSLPLLLAFYKVLLGAVEISRMPEDGPAFYVGLQIGNAELGMVSDGDADVAAPQRILLNVNVADVPLYFGAPESQRTEEGTTRFREYKEDPKDTVTLETELPQLQLEKTIGPEEKEEEDAYESKISSQRS